jgi:hypothetical protein
MAESKLADALEVLLSAVNLSDPGKVDIVEAAIKEERGESDDQKQEEKSPAPTGKGK